MIKATNVTKVTKASTTRDFIYLDHCGTTPISDSVKREMIQFIESGPCGNPAARHHVAGEAAFDGVEAARDEIAAILNAPRDGIVFTSGATEANNLVIFGFLNRNKDRGCRILVGASEHKSCLEPAQQVANFKGASVSVIPVDRKTAVINLEELEKQLKTGNNVPTLVVMMYCNNEVPARHPVEEISKLCEKYGAFFHCDSVQGIVREEIDFRKLGASTMVWTPHKIYGPKGVGVLVFNDVRPLRIEPMYIGGEQEKKYRPGTLNTFGICMTAVTLREHTKRRAELVDHLRKSEKIFIDAFTKADVGFNLTVPFSSSCPGIVNFWLQDVEVQSFLAAAGPVCVNRGASCTGAGGEKVSHVPGVMGLPVEIAANVVRASFGFGADLTEVERAADFLIDATKTIRAKKKVAAPNIYNGHDNHDIISKKDRTSDLR